MKKILSILTAMVFVFFSVNLANAQKTKTFQGTITYDISYNSATLTPAQKAMLPTSETVTIKDCKTKTETDLGQGASMTVIIDGSTKGYTLLLEYMGEKYAVKYTAADTAEVMSKIKIPTVKIAAETKVISGFTCKKAILTSTNDDGTTVNDTVYYSEEIGCKDINFMSEFKNVQGTILESTQYSSQVEGTIVKKTKEIKKGKVADTVFMIPSDAKEMTKEEFKKMFGGGE